MAKGCKLDIRPLDEGQTPSRGTMRCLQHGIILEGNNNGPNEDTKLKEALMFWRVMLEGRVQRRVMFKGFILPHIASNWSLRP